MLQSELGLEKKVILKDLLIVYSMPLFLENFNLEIN